MEATTINTAIIEYSVTEAALEELEAQYPPEAIPEDLSIKKNYEIVRKGVAHIRGLRSEVENHRKALKKDALEYGRKVDAAANTIKDRLLAIEDPMKTAKIGYDNEVEIKKREAARKEEERIDNIATRIAKIRTAVEANISSDSTKIKTVMDKISKVVPEEWADEFQAKAEATIAEALEKLQELFTMKEQSEQAAEIAAKAEAERLEREKAAKAEEEARLAEEAERQRLVKEQQAADDAKLQAEKDALQKEREAFEAEKRRAAEEEREAKEARETAVEEERKAAAAEKSAKLAKENDENNVHEAIAALERFLGLDKIDELLTAIRNEEIPHIRWV